MQEPDQDQTCSSTDESSLGGSESTDTDTDLGESSGDEGMAGLVARRMGGGIQIQI